LIILSIRQCRENQGGCYQGAYLANAVVNLVEGRLRLPVLLIGWCFS